MTDLAARLAAPLIRLAIEAGAAILAERAKGVTATQKADRSPVTAADAAAERIIVEGLAALAPGTPVLAEEAAAAGRIPALGRRFFLVDPLDGTKEFIAGGADFTVNIALVEGGAPILGVVYAPAARSLYWGARGAGAQRLAVGADGAPGPGAAIRTRAAPAAGLAAVASRSHRSPEADAFLATLDVADCVAAGSSLKFCRVAEGAADVYPRLGRTMEWDTAAGQAVLEAAGGRVVVHGTDDPLTYGKAARGFDNPSFIAWGR